MTEAMLVQLFSVQLDSTKYRRLVNILLRISAGKTPSKRHLVTLNSEPTPIASRDAL